MKTPGIIVGGGIGGLATALALHQRGIRAAVYERAPVLGEVGAGLVLAPNALHVCDRLGLLKAVEAVSWPLVSGVVAEANGQPLTVLDGLALARQYGYGMRVIQRGALQKLLVGALPTGLVHPGKQVIGVATGRRETRVTFADGSAVECGFVIGADGLHSAVRQAVFGPQPLRYSGQTCWRAIVDYALPPAQQHRFVEYWGQAPGLRVGLVPMSAQQVYMYLTAAAPAGQVDVPGVITAVLRRLTRGFVSEVAEVLRACDERRLHRADLFDLSTLPTWSAAATTLLGDAAHATMPNLGQGACQALEDAYTVAACLATHEAPAHAFARYQDLRKAKADRTVQLSRRLGQVGNLPGWLKPVLFNLIRAIPQSMSKQQLGSIYDMKYLDKIVSATPAAWRE